MKFYSILYNSEVKKEEDALLIYSDGFSCSAAIFQSIWAFFHGLWLVMLLSTSFLAALLYLEKLGVFNTTECLYMKLLLGLYMGFCAKDWHISSLQKRGYVLADVIAADNENKALLKFYEKQYKHELEKA